VDRQNQRDGRGGSPARGFVGIACRTGEGHRAKGGGLLDHVRSGKVEQGSNVAFVHTGDTVNLFEIAKVVGNVVRDEAEEQQS